MSKPLVVDIREAASPLKSVAADQSAPHDQIIAFLGSIDESLEQISGKE